MSFNALTRKNNLETLSKEYFDLIIIGGGISGAGVARDASSRGMKVALIEANDFASGTSSRSSKLIHGGLRYLENFEFGLVFEALSERKILFEIAPHLVHPLKFFLPIYQHSRVGMFKLGLGMWLYDFLSQFEAPEIHASFNKKQTMQEMSILNSDQLKGSYAFYDAYMDDDRLVLETLRSAHAQGAICANYVKATGVKLTDGKTSAVVVKDAREGKEFQIQGRHVISTVGPWTDVLGHELFKDWHNLLRPTKGVHLTFSRSRIPIRDAVIMSDDVNNRIVFVIPRHEMVIVGTTDTDFKADPSTVRTEREDVDYLLKMLREYFPGAGLEKKDIISSYAGVRPLVHDGSATESKTSREHTIIHDDRNITFVAGGKYTTYRRTSQQIVEEVLNFFPFEKKCLFMRNNTEKPINPRITPGILSSLRDSTYYLAKETLRPEREVSLLIERHGSEALSLLGNESKSLWELEALHAIENTMCLSIRDFYLRRTPLFLAYQNHGLENLLKIEKTFIQELGLSESEISRQREELSQHMTFELGWQNP